LGELHIVQTGKHVSFRVVNVMWIDLDALSFILHFLNQVWIASTTLVCRLAGSLSVTTTAVSSVKVAVVASGEVGRSAV
jgi:hypothetical protein